MNTSEKIKKEDFLKLSRDDITKKEYDSIISDINDRFNYIIRTVSSSINWWDYENCDRGTDGFFDPKSYEGRLNDFISITGEFKIPEPYNFGELPIRWLWEDFEDEFELEVLNFRKEKELERDRKKAQKEQTKIEKEQMRSVITSKLSPEELRFIKFK